jgi:anti-sigma28 factor (negative regulator of flagellin synthesis)
VGNAQINTLQVGRESDVPQASLAASPSGADRRGRANVGCSSHTPVRSVAAGRVSRRKMRPSGEAREPRAGIRRDKVRAIRRQIRQGSYEVKTRMATILDRVFEDLVIQASEPGRLSRGRMRERE